MEIEKAFLVILSFIYIITCANELICVNAEVSIAGGAGAEAAMPKE